MTQNNIVILAAVRISNLTLWLNVSEFILLFLNGNMDEMTCCQPKSRRRTVWGFSAQGLASFAPTSTYSVQNSELWFSPQVPWAGHIGWIGFLLGPVHWTLSFYLRSFSNQHPTTSKSAPAKYHGDTWSHKLTSCGTLYWDLYPVYGRKSADYNCPVHPNTGPWTRWIQSTPSPPIPLICILILSSFKAHVF
jgi:hypothetical protein